MSASFFGILKNHNHTNTVGDGGQLSALSVTSGLTVATGNLGVTAGNVAAPAGTMSEGVEASSGTDLPTLQLAIALTMMGL